MSQLFLGQDSYPPVFGSASLDWGLAEWHPSGADEVALSDKSDESDGSDTMDCGN